MPRFESSPQEEPALAESLGVLLLNLGTPDQPTPAAVRRYLRQFLSDPRIVEAPRLLWWLALHGLILRFRPAHAARAYRKIWTERGSPLLLHSQDISTGLETSLSARLSGAVHVEVGMSYGNPSIESALNRLYARNVKRLLLLPLYPQYSGSTTGSAFDAVTAALSKRRWVPEFRFINHYHQSAGYISALAASVREHWESQGRGKRLLFSFHGLPQQMMLDGDPYPGQCEETARQVAAALELDSDDWCVSYQSRVGRAEWLQPYTAETLRQWGEAGLGTIDVICPGFAADCLETLEEIALRYADQYAGAGQLRYIPALNARDDHIAFLSELVETNVAGWMDSPEIERKTGAAAQPQCVPPARQSGVLE